MFTKRPEQKGGGNVTAPESRSVDSVAPPAAASSVASSSTPAARPKTLQSSVIGSELKVVGNVASDGELQVEGRIEGDVQCTQLVISPSAHIIGEVTAEDVIVNGRLQGDIHGIRVTLQSNATVEGDIYHQSLAVEDGASFEGSSRRSADPLKAAARGNGAHAEGHDDAPAKTGSQTSKPRRTASTAT
ncbi:MAG: polymer-forming cytoskeletal protein [Hyphomicrobiales bacterium]|nr:polymer-forming cytoskeletal protein [Hyphomicrobiales bacterium]